MEKDKDNTGNKSTGHLLLLILLPSAITALLMLTLCTIFIRSHQMPANWLADNTGDKKLSELESWSPPDIHSLGDSEHDKLIKYGRELIAHTSYYLGPE